LPSVRPKEKAARILRRGKRSLPSARLRENEGERESQEKRRIGAEGKKKKVQIRREEGKLVKPSQIKRTVISRKEESDIPESQE